MPNKTLKKWSCSRLKEITSLKQSKDEVKSLSDTQLVSFVPMECLGINKKYFNSNFEKPIKDLINKYVYFAENDVIMAKITPCFENGKIGIAKNLKNKIGFGSSEYLVFRPNKNVLNEYLYYYLNRNSFREIGAQNLQGAVGHKRLSKEFIEETLIYYPAEIEEQQRIVKILDETFENIDKAKQNALQNLNNAKDLFETTRHELFAKNTNNWQVKKMPEIATNLDSKRIPITKNMRISGDIPYYGASGVVDYVKDYIFDDTLLLISEDGANLLMRTYPIAFSTSGKAWVNNHAHVLKFNDLITQKFVEYYLNSINLEQYITGAAQPKLNQTALNSIPIIYPPLTEQQKIVAQLDELQEQTKKLEQIYEQKIKDLDELKQSILQKAFNGEL